MSIYREFTCIRCNKPSKRRLYSGDSERARIRNARMICRACALSEAMTSATDNPYEKYLNNLEVQRSDNSKTKHYYHEGHHVQGLFELLYLQWLIENKTKFICHPLPGFVLIIDGKVKRYFPDFYLVTTEQYIDVKPYKKNVSTGNRNKIALLQEQGVNLIITTNLDSWFDKAKYRRLLKERK